MTGDGVISSNEIHYERLSSACKGSILYKGLQWLSLLTEKLFT